jgi:Ser/Thr protein kinase RdoA (MazF antagonist)
MKNMARGGAHFAGEELVRVLSYYDIGIILQVVPLSAGSLRSPKMVIVSECGKFLLKRRPKGRDDLYHVAFAHRIVNYLSEQGYAVTRLVGTCEDGNTVLQIDKHIYELFEFVSGSRYDNSAEATKDAGRQLALLHRHLAGFGMEYKGLQGSFHDSSSVRVHLKNTGGKVTAGASNSLGKIAEYLSILYNASSVRVNELGFDGWDKQIVHGDWHPGNMLFNEHKLVGVLDFDSVRIASIVTDIANGMLQFSIVAGRPNPTEWPSYLDQAKLVQFLNGYREVIELEKDQLDCLADLMIETMIAEAILPIAATGFFGNLSGIDFLRMIHRKAEWINKNRQKLTEAIVS